MFDLDAAIAEKRTHGPGPFPFRFGGVDFKLPAEVDLVAIDAITAGRILEGLSSLMGADQYARLVAVDEVLSVDAFRMLLEEWMNHVGADLGEAKAFTDS